MMKVPALKGRANKSIPHQRVYYGDMAQNTAMTINHFFHETADKFGAKVALRHRVKKQWEDITYGDLAEQVRAAAAGLVALGVEKGDRVALLSENRPEWGITDLATLALGGIVVPIYPTLPASQVGYIVRNSGAKVVVVEDTKQLKKLGEAWAAEPLPDLRFVVGMEGVEAVPAPPTANKDTDAPPVGMEEHPGETLPFADLLARGKAAPLDTAAYCSRWQAVTPDDVASLVYTSGTTGDPKGAMLTHGNFAANIDGSLEHYKGGGEPVTDADTFLSFLPLSHAYERTTGWFLPLRVGATIGYSGGVRTLMDDMAEVKPTIMVCVPRVYEAVRDRILDTVAKAPENRQKLFTTAIADGEEYAARKIADRSPGLILAAKHLVYERLVYAKLRERFGGHLRFLVSGGAALAGDTARFFLAIGIPISEGYGMTESAPVMSTNPVDRTRVGTVGTVIPGAKFRIADDGEILFQGPNVMKGYWKNDQATGEVIDADGWLHTGDIGVLDPDGYLKITDRKKDILVLANGKKRRPAADRAGDQAVALHQRDRPDWRQAKRDYRARPAQQKQSRRVGESPEPRLRR